MLYSPVKASTLTMSVAQSDLGQYLNCECGII